MNKSTTFQTFDSHSHTNLNLSQKYKIVLLGDQSVGKTAVINRFIFDTFDGKDHPTVGIDFISKTLYYDDKALKLQIWDTAGQERFRSLIPGYVRDCAVAIILYDITNRQTFTNLKTWIDDVRSERGNDSVIVCVGNKVDLAQKRVVTKEEGESFAKGVDTLFIEVSAKTGHNVSNLFQTIAGYLPGNESHRVHMHEDPAGIMISEPNQPNIQLMDENKQEDKQDYQTKSCAC